MNIKFFAVLFLIFNLSQSQEITGDWYGNLKVSGTEIPLIFHINKDSSTYSATMDSPAQGVFGLKADEINFEESTLKIVISASGIRYDGTYDEENEIIRGTFKQGGLELPLDVSKKKGKVNRKGQEQPLRPQEPKAPLNYRSEDITWD